MERRSGGERTRALWTVVKDKCRQEISSLDEVIHDVFGKRLKQAHYVGRAKHNLGEGMVDPERREKVIQKWENGFLRQGFQPGAGSTIAEAVLSVFENEQKVAEQKGDYRPKRKFFRM